MDVPTQERHLQAIGQRFAQVAPANWAQLVGNWEAVLDEAGEPVLNYLTLAVVDGGDRWLYGQVAYDEPLYDLVADFNRAALRDGADRRWTVLDLQIDPDGSYRSDLGYDEPKRSNGVNDEESMGRFENYLEYWVTEHGPVPGRAS